MIKFIINNKEWLFSGIGVTILVGISLFIRSKFYRNKKETQKAEIYLQPSKVFSKIDNTEALLVKRASLLSFSEIEQSIRKVPPLQRDEIKKNFIGIKVEWDGYLKMAGKETNDIVSLMLAPGLTIDDLGNTIHCKVSLKDYPELGILPERTKIRIQGEISKADMFSVELINVRLFLEKNR